MAASVGCDLLAVAADFHAAPAAVVGFGAISEPEHARAVFAALHKLKIGCREKVSSSLSQRRKNRRGRIRSPDFFDLQRARPVPNKAELARRSGQETVEDGRISALSGLAFLYERANIFAQGSRGISQRHPRCVWPNFRDRESRLFEPI